MMHILWGISLQGKKIKIYYQINVVLGFFSGYYTKNFQGENFVSANSNFDRCFSIQCLSPIESGRFMIISKIWLLMNIKDIFTR